MSYTRCWTLGEGKTLGDGYYLGQQITVGGHTDTSIQDRFTRQITASIRKPTFSVFIEKYGDMTEYVKDYKLTKNIEDTLHQPTHGRGWLTLYDQAGSLISGGNCVFKKKDKIKIWAGFEDTNIPRFTGEIYETKVNTDKKEVNIGFADFGYSLTKIQTSGDWSAYNTPKLLINELLYRINLMPAIFENEAGLPTTHTFTDTDFERRSYWALIHGATMSIFYIFFFDENGFMHCMRRDSYTDFDYVFTDDFIMDLSYARDAELINSKQIDHTDMPLWGGFLASDNVRFSQTAQNTYSFASRAEYGEATDSEADELISTFGDAILISPQIIDHYAHPGQIYSMRIPCYPELTIYHRVLVNSRKNGISGHFIVLAINETHSPGNWWEDVTIISEREKL